MKICIKNCKTACKYASNISIVVFALLLLPVIATANILVNPGFEDDDPALLYTSDNVQVIANSGPPSGWIVGAGDKANVVEVDGPGGFDYGARGPESDADPMSGSGSIQHYLDIVGMNNFWQTFTPRCSGTVSFGGYFSTRHGNAAQASIEIRQGAGPTGSIVGQTNVINLPSGNSKTDPWVPVSYTATITAGQTYSYIVAMDGNANFDNGHVDYSVYCPPLLVEGTAHVDDSLDLSFSPVLEINKTANGLPWQAGGVGSYQIVVTNTSGVVAPGSIIVVKDNANFPSPPLTLIGINGAPGWDCNSTPGQCSYTVPAGSPVSAGTSWTFTVNASIDSNYSGGKVQNCTELYLQGAGPLELQNSSCVSASIQPFIPPLITKRALGSMPWPSGGTGTFSISVNVPSSIASNEFIAIRDVLPNGLTLIPSSIVPAGMWNCNQSTGMCYLNGPIAAGTTVNISFDVQLPKQCGSVKFQNCADMDVVTDNPKFPFESQGQSCVTVEVAGCSGGCIPAKLSINKTHEPADFARGSTGMIGISVTNNGSSPLFAPIQVVDQLPSGLTMSPGSFSPSADLACVAGPTTPSPQQVSCSYMGSQLNAGDSFNFNFQVNVSPRASKIVTNHAFVTKGCCSGKANDETTDRIRIGKFGVISHTGGILLPRPPSHGGNITITKNHSPKQFSTGSKGSFKIVVKNKGNKLEKGMLTVVDHMPVGLSVKTGAFRANSWRCNGGKVSSSGQVVTCTYNRTLNKKRKAILNLNTRVAAVGKFPAGVKEVKNCATASVINGDIAVGKTMPTQEMTATACDKVKIRHVKSRGLFNLPISIGIGIGIGGGGSSGATPKGVGP